MPTNRFATLQQWQSDTSIYPQGDYLVVIPSQSNLSGSFPFKVSDGRRSFANLRFAPNSAYFSPSGPTGSISGPSSTTTGAIAIWGDNTGSTLTNGPLPSTFATAAQGALAETALQPGDPLTDLSSGVAPSSYVATSDGAGNIIWSSVGAVGAGDVTGPGSSTDNAITRFDGATGKVIQNSAVTINDLGNVSGLGTLNGNSLPASPGTLLKAGDDLTDLSSGAALAGQVPESDGAGNVTWATPAGGGDVVGPAGATDNSFARFDGITGKLLKDGILGSTGGNDVADSGLLALYNAEGQLHGSVVNSTTAAIWGQTNGSGYAGYFNGGTVNDVVKILGTGTGAALKAQGTDGGLGADIESTGKALSVHGTYTGVGTSDIAEFVTGLAATPKLNIKFDGGLEWGSTGAQTTATNLPAFGAATKGVVPLSGGGTTNFLRADGTWTAPPDTTGITQLTGDGTAGPGSGSQALTLATVNGSPGSFGSATQSLSATVNAKGLITALSAQTVTPAVSSITGLGTGVATALAVNVGTAGAPVVNGGALGTPSSGTLTNATGLPISTGVSGLGANVATFLATPSSANLAAALTDEAGTGSAMFGDDGPETAYSGTITFTAGVNPSGASSLSQFYTQVGNLVTWAITLTYAVAGVAVTNCVLTFPTQFPTPHTTAGMGGANARVWICDNVKLLSSPTGTVTNSANYFITRNAGDTAFEISPSTTFASGTYRTFMFSGSYFTS